ncbi:reverse transcriptase domain-containing protein, partial [Shigella flexneri]|uniref:reverse transcriptase domain-containing protein n=1 Tax=Shigella flexneri TaxID=623 RepID=UPI0012E7219B
GIFQGYSLSPLLFIIATMPLTNILSKCSAGYKFTETKEKMNHLMYMDDLKLFAKNKGELETLISTTRIFSTDIGMEFGIEKCALLVMKKGKLETTEGIELPIGEVIRALNERDNYKYLGILEADTIKQTEMKEIIKRE